MKIETQEQLEAVLDDLHQRMTALTERHRELAGKVYDLGVNFDALKMQHSLGHKLRGRQRGRPPDHGKKLQTVAQLRGLNPLLTGPRQEDYRRTSPNITKGA